MANIKKPIQFLRTNTAGKVPTAAQLLDGEIVINTADKKIFTKQGNSVMSIGHGAGATINGDNTWTGKIKASSAEIPTIAATNITTKNLNVEDSLNLEGGISARLIAENLNGRTLSLDSLILTGNKVQEALYYCSTDGGGSGITGRPEDNRKNAFSLRVEMIRYATPPDVIVKQTYIHGMSGDTWIRYYNNGKFSAWTKISMPNRDNNFEVDQTFKKNVAVSGNLNVTGKTTTADLSVTKNLSINGYLTIEDTIEVKKAGTFRDVLTVNGDINGSKNINTEGTVSARSGAMTVYAPANDNGTTHLWFRNADGKERAVIYSPTENRRAVMLRAGAGSDNSSTVTWTFNGSNGEITLPGGAKIAADGNTISSRWGNVWLTDWVQGLFNECAQWVRTGAQQDFGEIGRKHPGKTVPVGWVLIGLNAMDTESNQNLRLWGGRLQVWKQGKNWIDSAT
ncbi:TPA: hypothetical protein MBF00_000592 [Klebsiella aerogenes]|nr:hypothetical protein [Klebsiella aerogenes]